MLPHPKFYHSSLRISLSWRNLKSSRCKSGILISLVLSVSGRWSFPLWNMFFLYQWKKKTPQQSHKGRNFSTELIKIIPSPLVSLQSVFPQLFFFVHAKTKPWGFCHIFGTALSYEKGLLCNTNLNKICKLFFFLLVFGQHNSLVHLLPSRNQGEVSTLLRHLTEINLCCKKQEKKKKKTCPSLLWGTVKISGRNEIGIN